MKPTHEIVLVFDSRRQVPYLGPDN